MSNFRVPHDAIVVVGDGRKALFLRNEGSSSVPDLKIEEVFDDNNPPTREQGTERPGRISKTQAGQRSAVETTDWHELEEHRFARQVAAAAAQIVQSGRTKSIVIVAPARTLAELRFAMHPDVKRCVVAEVRKDLTRHSVGEIERHLAEMSERADR